MTRPRSLASMPHALRIVLALAVVAAGHATPAAQTPRELEVALARASSIDALERWLAAVNSHTPGQADAAARMVAAWSVTDLERLLPAVLFYFDASRRETLDPAGSSAVCDSCDASRRERRRLLRETESRAPAPQSLADVRRPNRLNELIARGVLLHSDAAMRIQLDADALRTGAIPSTNVLRTPRRIESSGDGQFAGSQAATGHWYFARALLPFITPEPALDPFTRRWYLAATAYFAANSDFAQMAPHFEMAQQLFPNDATVAFDMGWQSEAHATPRVQSDLRALIEAALGAWNGRSSRAFHTGMCGAVVACDKDKNPFGIKGERESLADAERHFARAIKQDATMTEACVRLAHVYVLMGRAVDAQALLEKLPPSNDLMVGFYAAMVRGKTLEALGRPDEAAAAYQRAHDLFPDAHSVNIALSALEQRRSDATRAMVFAQRAVDTPAGIRPPLDPMTAYVYGRGRDVEATWATLIATLETSR